MNEWLRKRAEQNELNWASRTYVVRDGERVVAYYSIAVGAVTHDQSPGRLKRNMPNPVPVMVLARLAVDIRYQGRRLGSGLLRDSIRRTAQVAAIAGIRGLLVNAIGEEARRFYADRGFIPSRADPLCLMITLDEALRL